MSGAHRPLGTGRRDYDLPTGKGKSFRATDLTQVGTLAKEGEKGWVLPTIRIGGPDGCPPLLRQRGNASLLLGPARDRLGLLVWVLRWLEHVAAEETLTAGSSPVASNRSEPSFNCRQKPMFGSERYLTMFS